MTRRRVGCALHVASAGSGTYGPSATAATRTRLRLPRTTRLVLRTSLAGSVRLPRTTRLVLRTSLAGSESKTLTLIKTLPKTHPHIFEFKGRLETLSIRYQDGVLSVHMEGELPSGRVADGQARLDLFRRFLEDEVGEPVDVTFEIVPVEVLSLRSSAGDAPPGSKKPPDD